jgi:hypothetical protein|tara:strand:+ start:387 stop:590 length:204 start_codon:yes stop_codon:yes gene_type:complete
MDSSIHYVKEVSITSRELGEGLGMSTRITVSSRSSWDEKDITEEIILFSNDKIITSLNGKAVSHQDR